jgi:hypothetical protein
MPKVISGFKCRYTGKIYHVGDEYDGDNLEEMQAKGYVEESIDEPKSKARKVKNKGADAE